MNTEKERADLLPCPFCGSTNIEIQISTPDREGVPTNLMCSDCGASGPWEYEQVNSHAKADAAWNTRAALQSQDREDESCKWHNYPETDNVWDTDCGQSFEIYEGTPTENGMGFCCYCGKPIREAIDHARRIEGEGE